MGISKRESLLEEKQKISDALAGVKSIYLKPSNSPLVRQDYFRIEELQARFRVIRLWEQPKELFFQLPGLLPFAVLSNTDNRYEVLKQVAMELDKIEERRDAVTSPPPVRF